MSKLSSFQVLKMDGNAISARGEEECRAVLIAAGKRLEGAANLYVFAIKPFVHFVNYRHGGQ